MASKSFGGTVKLTGESEYQKALRGIVDNLKVLDSEMKVITSAYDKNNASSEDLQVTNQTLNKRLEEQKQKVDVLKKALEDAKKETGENSDTSKKWQTELNKAQAEVNETSKKIDENTDVLKKMEKANVSNTKELKEFEEQERKAGDSSLKLGDIIKANLISEGIIAGIKGLGSAMAKVGSALVDVGKQAVQSYAEYEQLVGGVETLFGARGAKTVEEYANLVGKSVDEVGEEFENLMLAQTRVLSDADDAYKTAGLSANEYMETVTSISASLIQGLDGDTVEASKRANMAIIDMSDNANKMGTSMESIQNAYQGFAKQNYSMLDNLKLGYGGTQAEMFRLLQDAKDIDSSFDAVFSLDEKGHLTASYADIVEAIHIIQTEMGITGTTVDEAGRTISGSTGSMKSAWQNLITGIADDNANFEVLVGNLVESIVGKDGEGGGFINNMLPRIQIALDGIVTMVVSLTETLLPQAVVIGTELITNLVSSINENLPALLESASTILDTLINGVLTLLPTLIPMVVQIITTLTTSLLELLPEILQAGITILIELVKGISQALPELIPIMVRVIMDMVNILLDNIDVIIECGIVLLVSLVDGIMNALPELMSRLPEIIIKIVNTLIQLTPQLQSASLRIIVALATGLIKYIPEMISRIPQIIKSMISAISQGVTDFINIGKNLIEGLWNGISNAGAWLRDKISGMFGGVVDSIKDFFGIHSPSKLFSDEIGKNLALGVGEGFGETMSDVTADMQGAIPTEFDTSVNMNTSSSYGSNYDYLVTAFKEALKDVKVVMNNREMGAFIVNTVEREVYAQ